MDSILIIPIALMFLLFFIGSTKTMFEKNNKSRVWSFLTLNVESYVFMNMGKYHIQFYSDSARKWIDSEIDNPFLLITKISEGYLKYRYMVK